MIPGFLEEMLTAQYGPELTEKIKDGYTKRRPVTLRVNTLKTDPERAKAQLSQEGIAFRRVGWSREALILDGVREPDVRRLELYRNGEIYLQSLSSMLPPLLLRPGAKECVLDMAAAPGGKTTQMAALSGGLAQITACEKNKIRADRLRYNLEKQGASRVTVMQEDARKLDPFFSFDKILLDAPCSGSGTLYFPEKERGEDGPSLSGKEKGGGQRTPFSAGKETVVGEEWTAAGNGSFTKELLDRSMRTQEALLRKALQLLKPGCEMVYSTCSILEAENERILRRVLPGARAEVVPIEHPMLEEIPLLPVKIKGTCCICPTELYEGFFAARIRKRA